MIKPHLSKNYLVYQLFILIFNLTIYGQNDDNISIQLRDYHSEKVTSVLSSEHYPYYITADATGKILLNHAESKKVIKTLKTANDIPVENMRLIFNDRALMLKQKMSYDGSLDTIITIDILKNKVLSKTKANIDFVGNQNDVLIAHSVNPLSQINVVNLLNRDFKKIADYYPNDKVSYAAYDSITKTMAMVEKRDSSLKQNQVSIQKSADYKNIKTIPIPEYLLIQDIFFDNQELFALVAHQTDHTLAIHNLSKNHNFKNAVKKIRDFKAKKVKVRKISLNGKLKLLITVELGLSASPIIIEKISNQFKVIKLSTTAPITQSTFLKSTNEYLFFEDYMANFHNSIKFEIFNAQSNKLKEILPKSSKPFYEGYFLKQNNILISGTESDDNASILKPSTVNFKFYETGTFNNRFRKLNFDDYLEVYHNTIDISNNPILLDKQNATYVFYGYENVNSKNQYGFYLYDFLDDSVENISYINTEKKRILDYNEGTNQLLLSQERYYNSGYTKPQEFSILNKGELKKIRGLYKFGRFSKNGEYILLISQNEEVLIKEAKSLKTIYSEVLKPGRYNIFSSGMNSFLVSNVYYELNLKTCNKASYLYSINELNSVSKQTFDCINIKDIAENKNGEAIIVEDLGVIYNDRTFKFTKSEFPKNISLSEDAQKIMITFNNGKIKVFNTQDFSLNVEMQHPDNKSHIFINEQNYYFSNINPEDFIIATKGEKIVDIADLESDYFNPSKVLKSFGNPNELYLELLEKALKLKQKNLHTVGSIESKFSNKIELPSSKKGDLYLLAIGVSQYAQNEYDLTYADKDAIDISGIYGSLDSIELNNYKTKFFGNPYSLYKGNLTIKSPIKVYKNSFEDIGNLTALNKEATIWIEDDNNMLYLWDFNKNTRKKLNWEKFKVDGYWDNDMIFTIPDAKGFVLFKNSNEIFIYNFEEEVFKSINLPFEISNYGEFSSELLLPLNNNKWFYAKEKLGSGNTATIYYGKTNRKQLDSLSFDLNKYLVKTKDDNFKSKSSNIYNVDFQSVSANGNHLLYTFEDVIFYVDLSQEIIKPMLLDIKIPFDYSSKFSISDDGQNIGIHSYNMESSYHHYKFFNLNGVLIDKLKLNNEDLSVKSTALFDAQFSFIKKEEALVDKNFNSEKIQNLFIKSKPSSFETSQVKYLINDKATSYQIKKSLRELTKNVQPNDQAVVFMAGHGVLDENSNYYFAPHDMNFDNVSEYGVNFRSIIEILNNADTNNKLLLLDSCHAGNTLDIETGEVKISKEKNSNGKRGSKSRTLNKTSQFKFSDVISDVFDDFLPKSGVTVISASAAEDVAYENKNLGNGAFTAAYIKVLKEHLDDGFGGGDYLTNDDLNKKIDFKTEYFSEILKKVIIYTNGKQYPDLREINTNANLKMW